MHIFAKPPAGPLAIADVVITALLLQRNDGSWTPEAWEDIRGELGDRWTDDSPSTVGSDPVEAATAAVFAFLHSSLVFCIVDLRSEVRVAIESAARRIARHRRRRR